MECDLATKINEVDLQFVTTAQFIELIISELVVLMYS